MIHSYKDEWKKAKANTGNISPIDRCMKGCFHNSCKLVNSDTTLALSRNTIHKPCKSTERKIWNYYDWKDSYLRTLKY